MEKPLRSTRVVFMGSPDFALPSLSALSEHTTVVGVITQPDRPAGRGRALTPPPVRRLADQLGLSVIQPERLREPAAMEQLRAWQPDLIVVAAFGQILRSEVLELPPHGCLNVHASLLPRWRGAAPIQAAIRHGDAQTGVTIMRMDAGVDTGDILSQQAIDILPSDTAGTLSGRLSFLGAELLIETLPGYLDGSVVPVRQDDSRASRASLLHKGDGLLDFSRSSEELERQVRAFQPWPGAFFHWKGQTIRVIRARAKLDPAAASGALTVTEGLPAVGSANGWLVLEEIQPSGKKAMPGKAFLSGNRTWGVQ